MPPLQEKFIHEEEEVDHPVRYLPIRHLYSSTTPCVSSSGSSNVVSKKVKARRLIVDDDEGLEEKQLNDIFHGKIRWGNGGKQILVYRRRLKKPREMRETEDPGICTTQATKSGDFSDADLGCDMLKENEMRSPEIEATGANLLAEGNSVGDESRRRSRRRMKLELLKLGVVLDEQDLDAADSTQRRRSRRILSENKIALENPGNTSLLVVKSENFTVQNLENDNNKDERDAVMIGNDENLLISEGESIGNESKRHCSRSNFEPLYLKGVLADLDGNATGETRRRSRRLLKDNKNALEDSGNSEALILKCEIELENDKDKANEDRDKSTVGSVVNILVSEEDSAGDLSHRNRWRANIELRNLGVVLVDPHGDVAGEFQRRGSQRLAKANPPRKISFSNPKDSSDFRIVRRWVGLDIEGTDPYALVGLACKIFWPMDDDWYKGSILSYDSGSHQHHIKYSDGDEEHLIVADEKMQFNVSSEEIRRLNLKKKEFDHYEMLSLAVISEDCDVPEPGDVVWAKLTGHSKWPALIVNEPGAAAIGLKREQSFFVQFFGTHNFARVGLKQVMPFGKGVHCSLDLKCKHGSFIQSLNEVKLYLSNQQLPERMLQVQKDKGFYLGNVASDENEEGVSALEDSSGDEVLQFSDEYICLPIEIGNLRVTSLGRIVHDSVYFHRKHNVWPEGYTAYRKFVSMIDPSRIAVYKMEVLRNPKSLSRPLFRVTTADGEQIDGSNPTACWKEVYERLRSIKGFGSLTDVEGYDLQKSGTYMFGFSTPLISKYIQCRLGLKNVERLPAGYRAVRIEWKDLDRCNVCHMDEEYEGNLFLQCDNCRMMVHARCYGEFGPMDGELWQCKLCRNGAPRSSPVCCLCPVIGGAMKPTTDGQWAHLACAIWIPETCLSDVKKMEPIDGVNRIHKDRWKLLCSICHVTYGACIQCSNSSCCTAYHPLCARAAGYCVELEDEDKIHLMSLDDDDDQCIRLISFCKKHSPPPSERIPIEDGLSMLENPVSSYVPPANVSGCARTEPFNFARRGYKAPHILTATSSKRLYVENRPYLVTGYCQNGIASGISCNKSMQTVYSSGAKKSKTMPETSTKVSSMYEKYESMRSTYRTRLSFGKSRIHGFGVFAKLPHRAGDMVIEYSGELVRPSIADIREHCIYNSLVGAGTYMFRIDNNRVIDATKAGSIAHLINHSCEPNCYSRVISVNGDEHIIIFAKRDISQWEELAYDYRFFSKDELACCCGFSRCRGIVNDLEERILKIEAPRSDLKSWDGE